MSYRVTPALAAFVEAEWKDYINPVAWEAKKAGEGCQLLKKKEASRHDDIPNFKVQGLIPAPLDRIVDIVHTHNLEHAKELDPHFQGGHVLEKMSHAALGGVAEEGLIYYRQSKLPFVDNRDFVTVTLVREFKHPKTGHRVVGFFSKSIDDYTQMPPVPRGYTRGHVLSCCAFVEETGHGCLYTFTNKTDVHMKIQKAAAKGTKSFMMDYYARLRKLAAH